MAAKGKPRIEAYIGASGSGKGVSIEARLKELNPPRLLIWDPRDEYANRAEPYTLGAAVSELAQAGDSRPFRARIVHDGVTPIAKAFALFCRLGFVTGNLLLLAEELPDVTTPSYAPPEWKKIITQGRHRKLHVLAAAQRPALIDKTFLGNCTYIRCFTLRYHDDRVAMAKALDLPLEDISALATIENPGSTIINYIERDFRQGFVNKDRIVLRNRQ